MPVSRLIGVERLTPQERATFALQADQERRAAIRRGDMPAAIGYLQERNRLLAVG